MYIFNYLLINNRSTYNKFKYDKDMKHFNTVGLKTKKPTNKFISWFFAEAGGFEPPVPLRVRQFSKLVVSATHPHFLVCSVLLP